MNVPLRDVASSGRSRSMLRFNSIARVASVCGYWLFLTMKGEGKNGEGDEYEKERSRAREDQRVRPSSPRRCDRGKSELTVLPKTTVTTRSLSVECYPA